MGADGIHEYDFKTERIFFEEGSYEPHVYLIKVIDQGKYYVGSRTAKGCLRSDLGERYFTSSSIVCPVWKESLDNIHIIDIQLCKSNHDAQVLEAEMILEFALEDGSYLNRGYNGHKFNMSGSTFSDETRRRMSESRIGVIPWNKGKKGLQSHSKERKQRIGDSMKGEKNTFYGKTHSDEAKIKIGKYSKGRTHSEEAKLRIGESSKGRTPWNAGQSLSEEHNQKISESNKGKVRSEETKQRMSDSANKRKREECPHCLKTVAVNIYSRYHGEKCKYNQTEGELSQ